MRCLDVTEKTNDSECLVFLGGKPKKNTSQMYNSKNMFVYKLTKLILLLMFFFKKTSASNVCVCAFIFLCIFAAKSSPFMGVTPGVGIDGKVPFGKFRDKKKKNGKL